MKVVLVLDLNFVHVLLEAAESFLDSLQLSIVISSGVLNGLPEVIDIIGYLLSYLLGILYNTLIHFGRLFAGLNLRLGFVD